jgi:hypothetical protein
MSSYSKILFIAVLLSVIIGHNVDSITITSIPYILLIFYAFLSPDFYNRKFIPPIMFFIFVICLISAFLHGILAAKDLFISLGGFLCTQYYISKYSFSPQVVFMIYLLIFIPQFFYEYVVHNGANLRYIPTNTNWNLNVMTSNSTKHGTCNLGFLLLSASVFYFSAQKKAIYLFFVVLSIYFIIFSGSRGGGIALLSAASVYYINKNKVRKHITILLMILIIVFVYSIEIFGDTAAKFVSKNTIASEYSRIDGSQQNNVSSGRMWLWTYHIQKFTESNYLGGGREVVDFSVGDYVNGEIAKAGSESPFTGLLACYGIIGILLICLYFGMFIHALNRKNTYGIFIMTIAIIQTISTGTNYFSFMSYDSVLFFHLYFFSFNPLQYCPKKQLTL